MNDSYQLTQLDGNVSLNSSLSINETEKIQVHTGYRPKKEAFLRPHHSRKTLKRNNKTIQALTLPRISSYNMRSIFGKIGNFSADMNDRSTDISFLTEVWEKKENKKHQFKLEELLERGGIKYISTPRPGAQRGGGAAIAVRTENFFITKLNIPIPKSVEVVWGLMKPKIITGKISVIIVCCFYSPPRSRKNRALLDHITHTLQELRTSHPQAGVVISGDRNNMDMAALLQVDPSLRQIVCNPTRGHRLLDIILTNLHTYYNIPEIIPPIPPDIIGKGVPSDHRGVFVKPHTQSTVPHKTSRVKKNIRPIPESLLPVFGEKLKTTDFSSILSEENSSKIVEKYQEKFQKIVTETFPLKTITISSQDQVWFTEELRAIRRTKMREYEKHGKSQKYCDLQEKFDKKFQIEIQKYKQKVELEVLEGKRGSYYPAIKKLGLRPGEMSQPTFQLPEYVERNLSASESVELLANYFSTISQEYSL